MSKKQIMRWLPLTLALAVIVFTIVRLIDYKNWITAPNKVNYVFIGDNGKPISSKFLIGLAKKSPKKPVTQFNKQLQSDLHRCYPALNFDYLVHDNAVWTLCKLPSVFQVGLTRRTARFAVIRIDPKTRQGKVFPFPKAYPHYVNVGLARGPRNELAIVYATQDYGQLILGVVNNKGWLYAPQPLPSSKSAKLKAVTWASGSLEVVYRPEVYNHKSVTSKPGTMPVIARYANGAITTRTFPSVTKFCTVNDGNNSLFVCSFSACPVSYRDGKWHAHFRNNAHKKDPTFTISESSSAPTKSRYNCTIRTALFPPYMGALGHTSTSPSFALGRPDLKSLSLDGEVTTIPRPVNVNWKSMSAKGMRFKSHGLSHSRTWEFTQNKRRFLARDFGKHWIAFSAVRNRDEEIEIALLNNQGGVLRSRPVYKECIGCSSFKYTSMPIKRKDGGFWLVSKRGYYISLSPDLVRLDGRSIYSHLTTRGSVFNEFYSLTPVIKLIWILAGLPILVVFFCFFARVIKKSTDKAVNYSLWIYVVSAGFLFSQLWPLLH